MNLKVVLVTGITSQGLGASIAIKLAAEADKYKVYGTLRNLTKKAAIEEQATKANVKLNYLELDVSVEESCTRAVDELIKAEGRVDVLINNAGAPLMQTLEGTPLSKVHQAFEVNYFGPYRMMKLVVPHMRKNGGGRIINIASVGGLVGQPFNEAYCSAKAALDSLAESTNPTLRPLGIHVTSFCPGYILSNFISTGVKQYNESEFFGPYQPMVENYQKLLDASTTGEGAKNAQTPEQCADDVISVLKSENPPARFHTKNIDGFLNLKIQDMTGENLIAYTRKRFVGI